MTSFKRLAPLCLAALCLAGPVLAQEMYMGRFQEQTGEEIFHGVCQGCHMPNAQGAVGAGAYPALAHDERLMAPEYPALVILQGRKAMPSFGGLFSDTQIANVVNYVRTHFGNDYKTPITAEQVAALRGPTAPQAAQGEH